MVGDLLLPHAVGAPAEGVHRGGDAREHDAQDERRGGPHGVGRRRGNENLVPAEHVPEEEVGHHGDRAVDGHEPLQGGEADETAEHHVHEDGAAEFGGVGPPHGPADERDEVPAVHHGGHHGEAVPVGLGGPVIGEHAGLPVHAVGVGPEGVVPVERDVQRDVDGLHDEVRDEEVRDDVPAARLVRGRAHVAREHDVRGHVDDGDEVLHDARHLVAQLGEGVDEVTRDDQRDEDELGDVQAVRVALHLHAERLQVLLEGAVAHLIGDGVGAGGDGAVARGGRDSALLSARGGRSHRDALDVSDGAVARVLAL